MEERPKRILRSWQRASEALFPDVDVPCQEAKAQNCGERGGGWSFVIFFKKRKKKRTCIRGAGLSVTSLYQEK